MSSFQAVQVPFRGDLQGLRAVAVMLVIVAHAGFNPLEGGFVGVDIFFVLSGYLISSFLFKELQQSGKVDFIGFYAKRLKRLLPVLFVVLISTFIAASFLLSASEFKAQLASTPFVSAWLSNFYFSFSEINYFDDLSGKDLFLHTWSLGVEEQFYLFWPILLLVIFKITRLRGDRSVFAVLLLVFLSSLSLSLYLTSHYPSAGFYMMPSRIWQFSMGAMVSYFLYGRSLLGIDKKRVSSGLLYSFLGVIIFSAFYLDNNNVYPGYWAILPSLAAAAIILFSGNSFALLSNPLMRWLGDRSYSLYLWHWPVLMLGFSLGYQDNILAIVLMLSLTLLLSQLSFYFVEFPFWKGCFSHYPEKHIVLVSLLSLLLMVAVSFHLVRQEPGRQSVGGLVNQWRSDVPEIYRYNCDTWYYHAEVNPCVFGAESAPKKVALLADSIGAQWFSVFPAIFPEKEWRVSVFTKSACPIVDEDYFYTRIKRVYTVCSTWRNAVMKELSVIKPDVVIVGSAATYEFNEQQWIDGSDRIFSQLSELAGQVVVINGTPLLGQDGPSCIERNISRDKGMLRKRCSSNKDVHATETVLTYIEKAAARYPNVAVLDLNDLVCPGGICSALSEGDVVVYRDGRHLTDTFVRSHVSEIKRRVERYFTGHN